MYVVVFSFIALDFLTGMIKAFKEKNYSSSIMREGLYHKCGSMLLIGFGVLVEHAEKFIDLGVTVPVASMICGYIVLMEIGSIIENLGTINPEIVPSKMKQYFTKLSGGES